MIATSGGSSSAHADTARERTRVLPDVAPAAPLVSIVVRSVGRPELREALESLAAQDYPSIEIVVVDATGGAHPPLPAIAWRPGHSIRKVVGLHRLHRANAANLGLSEVRGELFGFLDDDDTCEPDHVSRLVDAAQRHPESLAVYGLTKWLRPDGTVERLHGLPFNRMLLHHGPLFCWQAALFRSRVIALGCRFRIELDRIEDLDFVQQVAMHSDLVLVDAATFRFRPDLGTSGTGTGTNDERVRTLHADARLRSAWAGSRALHTERSTHWSRRALAHALAGRNERARAVLEAGLRDYPDDPNALHGLARIALAENDAATAEKLASRAIEVYDAPPDFHATLEEARARLGARIASAAGTAVPPIPSASAAAGAAHVLRRLDPCPCGSGLRYKACCGRPGARQRPRPAPVGTDALSARVAALRAHVSRGEEDEARRLLASMRPQESDSADGLLEVVDAATTLGASNAALPFARRALSLGITSRTRQAFETCAARAYANRRRDSLETTAREVLSRYAVLARTASDVSTRPAIVIAGDLSAGRADRRTAWGLSAALGSDADVTLCSIAGPAPPFGDRACLELPAPHDTAAFRGGTLVLLDGCEPLGSWFEAVQPDRIVLHMQDADPEALVRRLAQIDTYGLRCAIGVALPGAAASARLGEHATCEYPWIDGRLARLDDAGRSTGRSLAVGHQDDAPGDRPNPFEDALWRRLAARGHRVVVPGARRGSGDAAPSPILAMLDVHLHRRLPDAKRDGGAALLDAMAAGVPPIVCANDIALPELVASGTNGFVVRSNDEALARIDALSANLAMRRAMGAAARASAAALHEAQLSRSRSFYLDVTP